MAARRARGVHGAWNFNTEKLLNDSPSTYGLVKDVVRRNGRPAL